MSKRALISLFLSFTFLFISTVFANNPFEAIKNNTTVVKDAPFLPLDQAFPITLNILSPEELEVSWNIAPHYYLFKNSIHIQSHRFTLGISELPQGMDKKDEILGEYQVFTQHLPVKVRFLPDSPMSGTISISYQGCAVAGFCYPPTTKVWEIDRSKQTITLLSKKETPESSVLNTQASFTEISNDMGQIHAYLKNQSFPIILIVFFGLGLLLSFTPCVLPMVPILSSILVGQGQQLTRKNAFYLSLTYWLSTSFTYAVAGIITASLGKSVQAFLQNPWVLGFTAGILVLLALSLFGVFELRLPHRLSQKVNDYSQKQPRGTLWGTLMMGILSALVVSPCITAPLLGALTYIAATGNVFLGGSALFLLGLGMGLPLFLLGTFGISLLPKAGRWMRYIQYALGILLILLALFLLRPFFMSASPTPTSQMNTVPYTLIQSQTELDKALAKAKDQNKPVMIDFYADWCASCLVLEHSVFLDPHLIELLKQIVVLRVDVTHSTPQLDAIQAHYLAFAPPTFIFYDKNGVEQPQAQIVGEAPANKFIKTLDDLLK